MPKFKVFDRQKGGVIEIDGLPAAPGRVLQFNLDGTLTPARDPNSPFTLVYDETTKMYVPRRQLVIPVADLVTVVQRIKKAADIAWNTPAMSLTGGGAADVKVLTGLNIRSDDPNVPALMLDNYQGKVIAKKCNFFGYGLANTARGIIGSTYNGRLDLEDCNFFSGNPMVAGKFAGRSAVLENFRSFRAKWCSHFGTRGFYLTNWIGDGSQTDPTAEALYQFFYNLDGRISDPSDPTGWRRGNVVGTDYDHVQMLQLNGCKGIPRVLVKDCESMAIAGQSKCEDIAISGYQTFGTQASPITVDRTLVSGQPLFDAWFDPETSEYYGNNMPSTQPGYVDARGYQNSGGGGLLGDGKGATYLLDPAWMLMKRSTILGMNNYGLGVASGHDHTLDSNVVLRSGYVRHLERDVKIAWGHVALQMQDYYTGGGAAIDDGTGTGTKRVRWYNNDFVNNTYGYTWYDPRQGGLRINTGLALNSPVRTNSGNVQVLDVTRAMEDAAETNHRQQWANESVTVGCRI